MLRTHLWAWLTHPHRGLTRSGRVRLSSARRHRRLFLETLEDRRMLAQVHWIADASGSWHTAGNWDTGTVPGPGDEVIVDRPAGDFTITYSSGETAVQGIHSAEALSLTGGRL